MKKRIIVDGKEVGEYESTGNYDQDIERVNSILEEMGIRKEVTPIQAMFRQALSFANITAYVYERNLRSLPRNGLSIVPFVVNSAFSIELYLKTIGAMHDKNLRGHELTKLYEALPTEAHDSIQLEVPSCARNRQLSEQIEFKECVDDLNGAFVEWRYIYEVERSNTFHIPEAIFVMEVLHEVCRKSGKV